VRYRHFLNSYSTVIGSGSSLGRSFVSTTVIVQIRAIRQHVDYGSAENESTGSGGAINVFASDAPGRDRLK
jgi:hypothetical protein